MVVVSVLLSIAAFVVLAVDFLLQAMWTPGYFRSGIPLMRKRFQYTTPPENGIDLDDLAARCAGSWWWGGPWMDFRLIGPGEVAFRVPWSYRFSWPLMHGVIRFDHATRTVTMTGCATWYIPPLVAALAAALLSLGSRGVAFELSMVGVALAFVALFHVAERSRYRSVFDMIECQFDEDIARPLGPL